MLPMLGMESHLPDLLIGDLRFLNTLEPLGPIISEPQLFKLKLKLEKKLFEFLEYSKQRLILMILIG